MIFSSWCRKGGDGLYISFKKKEKWNTPQNMGDAINLTGGEYCPMLTPDGSYLLFSSEKDNFQPYSKIKMTNSEINSHYDQFLLKPQNRL